jgi:hypothetical protein
VRTGNRWVDGEDWAGGWMVPMVKMHLCEDR